ncbi:MAG: PRC-barrel domain-containing protein [Candidatus Gracilibacteria bacterium]
MKLTFLKAVGTHIVSEQAEEPVALLRDIIINPDSGAILALGLFISKKIIPITDIREWTHEWVKIVDETAIIDREELIKLSSFNPKRTKIFGKEVYKEDGKFMGFVEDFIFDTEIGSLTQLYIVKKFLFISLEKRVVWFRDILRIEDDKIIIKNDTRGTKEHIKDFFDLRSKIKSPVGTSCPVQ